MATQSEEFVTDITILDPDDVPGRTGTAAFLRVLANDVESGLVSAVNVGAITITPPDGRWQYKNLCIGSNAGLNALSNCEAAAAQERRSQDEKRAMN